MAEQILTRGGALFHRFLLAVALVLAAATSVHADVVTLAWDQNPEVDVAGYRLSYGTASGVYSNVVDVPGKATLTVAVTVAGGARYFFTIQAYNTGGMVSAFAPEIFSDVALPPPVPLPAPWIAGDVGGPALAGLTTVDVNNVFTVTGAGTDIWGTADQFQFVSQPLTGDGTITARVDSLGASDPFAKAGVMWREDTTAGAPNALAYMSGGNGLIFSRRVARNGVSTSTSGTPVAGVAPYWVRLVRSGMIVSAYASPTGTTWTLLGTISVPMTTAARVGLAVTSLIPTATTTGVFSNVSVVMAPILVPPLAPIRVGPRK